MLVRHLPGVKGLREPTARDSNREACPDELRQHNGLSGVTQVLGEHGGAGVTKLLGDLLPRDLRPGPEFCLVELGGLEPPTSCGQNTARLSDVVAHLG
jgi:hypothetical protein